MRIRRKSPKPSRSSRPLFIIGHSRASDPSELQLWFDSQYGGPLRLRSAAEAQQSGTSEMVATHGPWSVTIDSVSEDDASTWRSSLGWDHPAATQVLPMAGQTGDRINQALHAARIARGLTLLSQGTSYDVLTQQYFNPSDWRDRDLSEFLARDHITVRQTEAEAPGEEWFSTQGLTKFGLDELEIFRPRGLSATPIIDRLTDISDVLIRQGQIPKVGSVLELPELALSVGIRHHRTANIGGMTISLREIAWDRLAGP
jgi:hypothetical protein